MSKILYAMMATALLYPYCADSFHRKKNMRMYDITIQVGVTDDEVIIGEPVICLEGSHVVECHCDQRATAISFKKDGSMQALCKKHYNEKNGFGPSKSDEYIKKESLSAKK